MIRMGFIAVACLLLSGCKVQQCTEMTKFTHEMNLVKTHRPDLYDQHMAGTIVIDDVYPSIISPDSVIGVDYHRVVWKPLQSVK